MVEVRTEERETEQQRRTELCRMEKRPAEV